MNRWTWNPHGVTGTCCQDQTQQFDFHHVVIICPWLTSTLKLKFCDRLTEVNMNTPVVDENIVHFEVCLFAVFILRENHKQNGYQSAQKNPEYSVLLSLKVALVNYKTNEGNGKINTHALHQTKQCCNDRQQDRTMNGSKESYFYYHYY